MTLMPEWVASLLMVVAIYLLWALLFVTSWSPQ